MNQTGKTSHKERAKKQINDRYGIDKEKQDILTGSSKTISLFKAGTCVYNGQLDFYSL